MMALLQLRSINEVNWLKHNDGSSKDTHPNEEKVKSLIESSLLGNAPPRG